jgi:hypothetical protein
MICCQGLTTNAQCDAEEARHQLKSSPRNGKEMVAIKVSGHLQSM